MSEVRIHGFREFMWRISLMARESDVVLADHPGINKGLRAQAKDEILKRRSLQKLLPIIGVTIPKIEHNLGLVRGEDLGQLIGERAGKQLEQIGQARGSLCGPPQHRRKISLRRVLETAGLFASVPDEISLSSMEDKILLFDFLDIKGRKKFFGLLNIEGKRAFIMSYKDKNALFWSLGPELFGAMFSLIDHEERRAVFEVLTCMDMKRPFKDPVDYRARAALIGTLDESGKRALFELMNDEEKLSLAMTFYNQDPSFFARTVLPYFRG